ncbi:sororin [Rhinophrynus dorsalis]
MSGRKKRRSSTETHKEGIPSPPKRRSQRKSASENKASDSPMPAPVIKRSITVKKIMPRKTLPASKTAAPQSTPKVLNVTAAPRRSSRISPISQKENSISEKPPSRPKDPNVQPSSPAIDILSPIPVNIQPSPAKDDRDRVMSQKVRRSYSRLEMSMNGSSFLYSPTRYSDSSDTSTPNAITKAGRRSLFGFDKLLTSETPEEEKEEVKKGTAGTREKSVNETTTGTAALEQPDHNIPGITLNKQKRRKRKVPQIQVSDLDEWAAIMNAEFEEAEKFDLHVE